MSEWLAGKMLTAVEEWAYPDYWMMRESVASVQGRIDGILVPCSFEASVFSRRGYWTQKACVVGVEIKASRADFQRGLREGQFERYKAGLANLFLCTGRDVKTAEIPEGFGHLVYHRPPGESEQIQNGTNGTWTRHTTHPEARVVCRRQPKFVEQELDQDTAWRIVMYAAAKVRDLRNELRAEHNAALERVGRRASEIIRRMSVAPDRTESAEVTP